MQVSIMKKTFKRLFTIAITLIMAFSCASAAFAAEVPAEVVLTPVEQLELEETNANTLYSSSGYVGQSTFPASGEFDVPSFSFIRVSYGFLHPNLTGSSPVFISINRNIGTEKNKVWEYAGITVELTADQTSRVADLGYLDRGEYQFVLNGHSNLAFATVTIYSV